MRRVDDELATDRLLLGEPDGHPVVGRREGAQLGRALFGHASIEVAVGDPRRAQGETFDRPGQPAGKDQRDHEGHDRRHGTRDDDDLRHAGVEHLVGVVRALARRQHERLKGLGPHPQHAERHDREGQARDPEGGEEEPRGDAVAAGHRAAARRSTGPAAR